MTSSLEQRRRAILEVGRFMGTLEGLKLFKENDYVNDTRILCVPESEPLDVIIEDHMASGVDTLVAVFFPERVGAERFAFLSLGPLMREKPDGWDEGESTRLGRNPDGHMSSIGIIADLLSGRRRVLGGSESTYESALGNLMREFSPKIFEHA